MTMEAAIHAILIEFQFHNDLNTLKMSSTAIEDYDEALKQLIQDRERKYRNMNAMWLLKWGVKKDG